MRSLQDDRDEGGRRNDAGNNLLPRHVSGDTDRLYPRLWTDPVQRDQGAMGLPGRVVVRINCSYGDSDLGVCV